MGVDVSVILPCRNEEKTIGKCIQQIKEIFRKEKINGEIIVSDSSSDNSAKIAKQQKVKLVKHDKKGYGVACMEAIRNSNGKYIIIGDADGTYDFSEIPLFIRKLEQGNELVIGSRLKGRIKSGAMPFLHRYIGNPLLSFLLNLFFHTKISDSNSGFRAIKKKSLISLELKTTGMEFASEMIIKAAKKGLKIAEVPITYSKRIGESKLKSFSDGWRHIRFMLMFSPTYLFFIPGFLLLLSGLVLSILMLFGTFITNGRDIGLYVALLGTLFSILGYQVINLGLYSKIYAIHTGFEKEDKLIDFIAEKFPLERGILTGAIIVIIGLISFIIFMMRLLKNIPIAKTSYPGILFGLTLFVIGIQTIFSVFFISIMLIEKKK
jgi:glycosyltransferase involved in cell wall biosynthesis